MRNDDQKLGVALTKCYFCGEGHQIILNTRLSASAAKRVVEDFDGKVVDMTPCPKCEEMMKQGVALIVIDESKCHPGWNKETLPNPYRTGHFMVVRDEAIKRIFHGEAVEFALKHRFTFVDIAAATAVGLIEAAEKAKTGE